MIKQKSKPVVIYLFIEASSFVLPKLLSYCSSVGMGLYFSIAVLNNQLLLCTDCLLKYVFLPKVKANCNL